MGDGQWAMGNGQLAMGKDDEAMIGAPPSTQIREFEAIVKAPESRVGAERIEPRIGVEQDQVRIPVRVRAFQVLERGSMMPSSARAMATMTNGTYWRDAFCRSQSTGLA